jgi:SAM-dependent methyltransferase
MSTQNVKSLGHALMAVRAFGSVLVVAVLLAVATAEAASSGAQGRGSGGPAGGQGRSAPPPGPVGRPGPAHPGYPGAPTGSNPASSDKPKPRLFRAQDLGLLEAADRDQWQKPDQIMDALKIADGATVADLAAGGGWFTIRLAHRVGPNGLVYAEDIQPSMIEAIKRKMQTERLANVIPVLGTVTDPRLPDDGLDAILIVAAFGEMEDPVTLLRNAGRSLKPTGCLGVVDFTPGSSGPGPDPEQRVDPDAVVKTATAAGFTLSKREPVPPFQYLLVFSKTESACR